MRIMPETTSALTNLVDQLGKLPGIGRKSAERLAFHLLRVHETEAFALADAIRSVRENIRYCSACFNLSESELCSICSDVRRDTSRLCIVEQPRDLMALEQAAYIEGCITYCWGELRRSMGSGRIS